MASATSTLSVLHCSIYLMHQALSRGAPLSSSFFGPCWGCACREAAPPQQDQQGAQDISAGLQTCPICLNAITGRFWVSCLCHGRMLPLP